MLEIQERIKPIKEKIKPASKLIARSFTPATLLAGSIFGSPKEGQANFYDDIISKTSTGHNLIIDRHIPSLREDLLNLGLSLNIPEPTSTPTIGGRGFSIRSEDYGIVTDWERGTVQMGYLLYRFSGSGVTVFPRSGMLSALSTSYAITESFDPAACFVVVPLGPEGPLGNSDVLCAIRNIAVGIKALNLTLRLNESSLASFSWLKPQGEFDGFRLISLDGSTIVDLPATSTSTTHSTRGIPTCYTLATIRAGTILGITDLLCGIPGVSNLPNPIEPLPTKTPTVTTTSTAIEIKTATATSTSTSTATSTKTLTPTKTPTPTRQPTPNIHPYYTQTLSAEGILIKAPASVDSRALQITRDRILLRTSRADILRVFVDRNTSVGIFPQNSTIRDLPELNSIIPLEFASLAGWLGELRDGTLFVAIKESCLILNPPCGYPLDYDALGHELGHLIHFYGLPNIEQSAWDNNIFPSLVVQNDFPNNWRDILYYPDNPNTPGDDLATSAEFFAEITQVWPRKNTQVCSRDQDTCKYFRAIYIPR